MARFCDLDRPHFDNNQATLNRSNKTVYFNKEMYTM